MADEKQIQTDDQGAGGETPKTFTAWLEAQPADVKELYNAEVAGLKSALDSERTQAKAQAKELRDAAAKAEAGSEAQQQLEAAASKAEIAERRATFNEDAHAAGVGNLRLAWLAALDEEDLTNARSGTVDFEKMKARHPELFAGASKPPAGNAGSGAGQEPTEPPNDMNTFILRSAGRIP